MTAVRHPMQGVIPLKRSYINYRQLIAFRGFAMRRVWLCIFVATILGALATAAVQISWALKVGRQPDGSFLVSSGQRVVGGALSFTGRPIDLARHPTQDLFAVLNKSEVFLLDRSGMIRRSAAALPNNAGAGF